MKVDWEFTSSQIERFLPGLVVTAVGAILVAVGDSLGVAPLVGVAVLIIGVIVILLMWARSKARRSKSHLRHGAVVRDKSRQVKRKGVGKGEPGAATIRKETRLSRQEMAREQRTILFEHELDSSLTPFDHHSHSFEKNDVIWVEVESQSTLRFNIFICDEEESRINRNRRKNFEFRDGFGREYTTQFRQRMDIPKGGKWYFCVWSPYDYRGSRVALRVFLISR